MKNKTPKLNARVAADNIAEEQDRDHAVYFDNSLDPEMVRRHNEAVVNKTIKEYEAIRKRKHKEYVEQVAERADAVATYLKSRVAEGSTPIEKYFGKRMMAHLAGQKIMAKLQHRLKLHQNVTKKGVLAGERKIYLPGDE